MKSTPNSPGVSILEQLLSNHRKTLNLVRVLEHFKLKIHPRAEASERQLAWIVEQD